MYAIKWLKCSWYLCVYNIRYLLTERNSVSYIIYSHEPCTTIRQRLNRNWAWVFSLFSVTSAVFPLLGPTQVLPRLFSVAFAFFPVYLLLSLLYPFFCVLRQILSKLKMTNFKVYAIHVLVSVIPVYYQVLKHQFHRVFFQRLILCWFP